MENKIIHIPDVADVLMYALDNGKHDVHISYSEHGVHINIYPIKEKENEQSNI